MRAVVARTPGDADVLEMIEVSTPDPGPGEVRIKVRTSAVNRADILQRQGRYPVPPGTGPILGLEAAGTIDAIGDGAIGWAIGDRVMALLSGGGYAEYVAVPAGQVLPVPANLNWILAAAVPEVFLTAWQALGRQTPADSGDWVLVHAAGSGVGTTALQIARERGAHTIGTTRSLEKAEQIQQLADHVLVLSGAEFADAVADLTGGHGADVIIDLVGAAYWAENLRALATDGAIALIGMVGGARTELDLGALMARRARVVASTLRARSVADKSALVASFRDWGIPRLADGRLRPLVHDLVPLTRVADAHREVERDKSVGKVVLAISEDGLVAM